MWHMTVPSGSGMWYNFIGELCIPGLHWQSIDQLHACGSAKGATGQKL